MSLYKEVIICGWVPYKEVAIYKEVIIYNDGFNIKKRLYTMSERMHPVAGKSAPP